MKNEFFRALEERGEEPPTVPATTPPDPTIINDDFRKQMEEEERRIKEMKTNYENDLQAMAEQEQRLAEREEQMQPLPVRNMMNMPARPESDGASPGAIPAVRGYGSGDGHVYGAVSGTDSESDAEFLNKLKGNRKQTEFRWTPDNE